MEYADRLACARCADLARGCGAGAGSNDSSPDDSNAGGRTDRSACACSRREVRPRSRGTAQAASLAATLARLTGRAGYFFAGITGSCRYDGRSPPE